MNCKLELRDVSYVYGGGTPFEAQALKNINLTIETGAITGIIGHTGSGKSTLVRLFNGLERPTCGEVLLDGENIWQDPKQIGRVRFRVGLVMQYPENIEIRNED
jgi:energy-coupling factor transport system ATP-binding protein